MQIKLKVPAKIEREFPVIDSETNKPTTEKRRIEYVSQGNFDAELKPNATIEVSDRRFADWLISEYGLKEIVETDDGGDEQPANDLETQYPIDFPKRKVFITLGISFETARSLSREQLININGIAGKTADEILAWQPTPLVEPVEPIAPVEPVQTENNTDGGEK